MVSPLPWKLDEHGQTIFDAEGEVIAQDYRFRHVDDFEAICRLVNSGALAEEVYKKCRTL